MPRTRDFQEASASLFGFSPAEDDARFRPPSPTAGGPEGGRAGRSGKPPSYIADHRARLRERFLQDGGAAMPDYELLELVLFRAVPRQDMKPLARRLLDRFGDFNRVLSAEPARLAEIEGVGPAVVTELKIVAAAARRLARSRVIRRPVLTSWDALIDYCHTAMAHGHVEQFRVLYLDRKNVLIADEEQARGTVDHVPVYPREIVRRALEVNASALILVHNHPSGDPTPSEPDIVMTRRIVQAAETMSIVVHDHLIIGKDRELSFRAQGLL
ncbi:DNA repair protein RadC [uncultured Paracoccus sp.]|uniref:RadC family protein n=1 Tax=uncultured Paracoccus sp. TaxID=189685 RepID=UPI002601FEA7|nr:DNA repair protein RadC [uncultured Paracoccus sp.]